MSARVFTPHVMSEMRQVMRGGASGREVARVELERIKKNLFNVSDVDQAESKQFAEKQLAATNDLASKRWGFSFQNEKPLTAIEGNTSGFEWQKVRSFETVPEAYALRRMSYLNSHTEETVAAPSSSSTPSTSLAVKQLRVDDFMKHTKRPRPSSSAKSNSLPSLHNSEPAAKRARTRSS